MDHYLDISIWPDPDMDELTPVSLMNALFAKLHRQLGRQGHGRVGVSFPAHGATLGHILRLHGTLPDLQGFMLVDWRQGLKDLTRLGEISPVPAGARFRVVRRIQAKSAHNKRQRSIRKGWLTAPEALARIPDSQQKHLAKPYAELRSGSNGNLMRVYIEHGQLTDVPQTGVFSAYGLSGQATVPWF